MPWCPMLLRGQRVLARCEPDGSLRVDNGKVEIRYRPTDGRAYAALAANLAPAPSGGVHPDEHCVPGERVAAKATKSASGAKKSGRAAGSAAAPPEAPTGAEVLAYADGACSGNPGPCGLGVVLLAGEQRRELYEYLGRGTNNIAELTAILRVAEAMDAPERPLRVYTDSSYSIGVLTKGWKAKVNQELIAGTKAALARLADVELIHVRGHAGVPLNERADALARMAVEERASSGWVEIPPR